MTTADDVVGRPDSKPPNDLDAIAAGRTVEADTTGLYFMRARYYDPMLGRFISEDPDGLSGGINQYTYAGNDPVNARDPSGRCTFGACSK